MFGQVMPGEPPKEGTSGWATEPAENQTQLAPHLTQLISLLDIDQILSSNTTSRSYSYVTTQLIS